MSRSRSHKNKSRKPYTSAVVHVSHINPLREFWLPVTVILGLVIVVFTKTVQQHSTLMMAVGLAAAALAAWLIVLAISCRKETRVLGFQFILRKQHYIQAGVQLALFAYWGYYWQPVYDHAPHIVAQLLFAYGFDLLLSWSLRRDYVLGAGPFPIIFSINLFLWFKDDWFYLQFVMIAVGLLGKEFVRWQRDNKSVHIFNPSAFTLGFFSLLLVITGTTNLTWGQEIASTLTLAPHIYLVLFLLGLVVMYFFAITAVAATAAAMLFALSAISYQIQGVPYFLDSEIPAAVFLGLHLLITDPSTSPKNMTGKILFGALYGIGVFVLYALLTWLEVPTFYDKLLCVPLLNLSVIAIDRLAARLKFQSVFSLVPFLGTTRANFALMLGWVLLFGSMTMLGKTDGRHVGDQVPFWQQACNDNRSYACERLLLLESTYCSDNSAWACNELGLHYREESRNISREENREQNQEEKLQPSDNELANSFFARACELRWSSACLNLLDEQAAFRESPHDLDLRLMLREGGLNLMQVDPDELHKRACQHGWDFECKPALSKR